MLKRILFFSNPYLFRLASSQLIVEDKMSHKIHDSIPIEDIGYIILEDPQIIVALPALNALSDNNVSVILCGNNRMPKSILMNLDSNTTMAETYRIQLCAHKEGGISCTIGWIS